MAVRCEQPVKAFDLVPVLDYRSPTGTPSCVSVAGNDVYIGYTTGVVKHFLVSSTTSTNGRTKYQIRYLDEMIGASKKVVRNILVAPTIARIIGLADTQVFVGDMFSMVGAATYSRSTPRSVTYISVNENSTSYDLEIAVCQSRKKCVILMLVTSERFIIKQELSNLQSVPVRVMWHGSVLLLAYESYYAVYNLMSRTEMELFPYNSMTTSPLIRTLGDGEIYLNGEGLGMIINQQGDVCRPPIPWVNQPKFVCYSNPYIVGISQSSIQVFSLLDQQLKQKSGFTDALGATHFIGNVFIVREEEIFMLIPVPVELQVERLLESGHIDQAMVLADETLGVLTRTKSSCLKALRARAARVYWERGVLSEAFSLFAKAQVPPAAVCVLYDTIGGSGEAFVSGLGEEKQREYHAHLLSYIDKCGVRTEELNTAEFKLTALTDSSKLKSLINDNRPVNMNEIIRFLKDHNLIYMLGEYYARNGFVSEAVEVWRELEDSGDAEYPGISCIVDLLLNTNIQAVIMGNLEWLLARDCDVTLSLLRHTTATINHDAVLTLLESKPLHSIAYLEEIVISRRSDISRYHTQLALQYLAIVLSTSTNRQGAVMFRKRLQAHLLKSNHYAVSLILNKVEGTLLKKELAILYGKLQEHEKALKVLVYDVHDAASAEEYCREWPEDQEHLHYLLLKIYLDCQAPDYRAATPDYRASTPDYRASTPDYRASLQERAVGLLNDRLSVFKYSDVYKILPKHWPLSLLEPFVYRSLGKQAHDYRTSRIVKGLSELEWARARSTRIDLTKRVIRVTTGTYCSFCFHPFSDTNCSVSIKGDVYHSNCLNQIPNS